MGVQQVRGAVQGDHRLAGAGTALHNEHARQLGPDDLVLLALDRGDDVAEATGAVRLERGEQRALALERERAVARETAHPVGIGAETLRSLTEELVLDAEQLP